MMSGTALRCLSLHPTGTTAQAKERAESDAFFFLFYTSDRSFGALCYKTYQEAATRQELLCSRSAVPGLAVEVTAWGKGSSPGDCTGEGGHWPMKCC